MIYEKMAHRTNTPLIVAPKMENTRKKKKKTRKERTPRAERVDACHLFRFVPARFMSCLSNRTETSTTTAERQAKYTHSRKTHGAPCITCCEIVYSNTSPAGNRAPREKVISCKFMYSLPFCFFLRRTTPSFHSRSLGTQACFLFECVLFFVSRGSPSFLSGRVGPSCQF